MKLKLTMRVWVLGVFLFCIALGSDGLSAGDLQFDRHVRPILAKNCYHCHGPDEDARETDLRLDHEGGLNADLGGYQAVVPHSTADSELFLRIASDDPEQRMPPPDSEYELTDDEIAVIGNWIEQGAVWKQHWSFAAPKRPGLPDVGQLEWCRNSIDRFVRARLETEGIEPMGRADRRALIRRLTFDLTGLPPTINEVHNYLSDSSPDAYERLVDRLLNSPHYGEHMARFWLDAARYGDTHGLHVDNYREMWPYRNWVIQAFNSNLPYDQFLVEQLAGDLLPQATLDQQIASGFNRCHVTTNEGGSIAEEVYVRNVIDRVSTFGTATMGLTLGCAVCHDHKFDPITQQDFYQLFAFFNSLDGPEMDGNIKHPAPVVRVPTPLQAENLLALEEQIDRLQQQCEELLANRVSADPGSGSNQKYLFANEATSGVEVVDGLVGHYRFDEGTGNEANNAVGKGKTGALRGNVKWIDGKAGGAIKLSDGGFADLGDIGDLREEDTFSFGAWFKVPDTTTGTLIARMNVKNLEQGYHLSMIDGQIVAQMNSRWPGYAIKITTQQAVIQPGRWTHLFVTYDGRKLAHGLAVYVDGNREPVDINCDSLRDEGSIDTEKALQIGRRDQEPSFYDLAVDDLRIYDRELRDDEVRAIYLLPQAARLIAMSPENWSSKQQRLLLEFSTISSDPAYQDLAQERSALLQNYNVQLAQVATTPIFRERRKPITAFLLVRGQYDQQGNPVGRLTPAMLPQMDDSLPRNRLGLARWLTNGRHPLTSRVAVNRFWQQLFGIGLVETSEDFGIQGTSPSHPDLLDWLAYNFQDEGWNVKALLKAIVMSSTYQQSSQLTPQLVDRDPRNRLLARGPRYRLDAEMLRDQALAVSGLLVRQVGGPSVKPPQPDGLWRAVGLSDSNTVQFEPDHGADKVHRRSMYTFWKRTSPPPQMSTFDAPSREACTMRRERTNTPLQALLLMNDPQYLEAARHFAERILQTHASAPEERLRWAFEQVTLRPPTDAEVEELLAAYNDLLVDYTSDQEAARAIINVGEIPPDDQLKPTELATWTMVANILLNLDEVITKE